MEIAYIIIGVIAGLIAAIILFSVLQNFISEGLTKFIIIMAGLGILYKIVSLINDKGYVNAMLFPIFVGLSMIITPLLLSLPHLKK